MDLVYTDYSVYCASQQIEIWTEKVAVIDWYLN